MIKNYLLKPTRLLKMAALAFCLIATSTESYAQQLQWFNYQDNYPNKLVTDSQGNIYVTGTDVYTNDGQSMNVFLRKYTPAGTLVWERLSTHPFCCHYTHSRSVAIDDEGNVYVAGNFRRSIQFENTLLESSYSDVFLAKYTSDGSFLWATSVYSSTDFEGEEFVSDLKIDNQNNPVIIGTFQYEMKLDETLITSSPDGPSSGMSSYILKATTDGEWLSLSRLDIHFAYSLDIDLNGDYVIGGTQRTYTLARPYSDPETGEQDTSYIDMYDLAVAKYNAGGSLSWRKQYGNPNLQENFYEMQTDTAGNVYMIGYDHDPLINQSHRVTLVKVNNNGDEQWTRAYTLSNYTPGNVFICTEVTVDNNQNVVFGGQLRGTVTIGGNTYTSSSERDLIFAQIDPNGNFISATTSTGTGDDILSDMIASPDNSLYVTGFTYPFASATARTGLSSTVTGPSYFISKYNLATRPDSAPSISGFTLINADNGEPVKTLVNGDTINIASLPTKNFNIIITTSPLMVGSVRSVLNKKVKVDNTAPYTVKGDKNGRYSSWRPAVGKYSLSATAYELANAKGVKGGSRSVDFFIIDEPVVPVVTALILVDAVTDQELGIIQEGDQVDLASLPNKHINIRAAVQPKTVGSVRFVINNKEVKLDNSAPYALYYDNAGDYKGKILPTGNYTLTATASTETDARGKKGPTYTLHFTLTNSGAPITTVTVFPNPIVNTLTVSTTEPLDHTMDIQIVDFSGQLQHRTQLSAGELSKDIDITQLPKGIYILKTIHGDEEDNRRIVKE